MIWGVQLSQNQYFINTEIRMDFDQRSIANFTNDELGSDINESSRD